LKRPGFIIVWPSNIDNTKSRGLGRKIPQSRAVRLPNLREMTQAATTLGYTPEPAEKKARPITPWEKTGYLTIKRTGQKTAAMKLIATEIARSRQREFQAAEDKPARR